jgi:formylglycine-generating enzyme required for sulfatase activity
MTTLFISHSSKDKSWALRIREALRDNKYESLFLDSHPDDGIHAGADWEDELWQKLRRSRGVVVLCTAQWLCSPWCIAEAMIARERGKPLFLLADGEVVDDRIVKDEASGALRPRLPDFLKDTQFISLAGLTDDEVLRRLWRGLDEEGLTEEFPPPKRPYPGLEPFQETDAAVFFGRNDDIKRVQEALNRAGGYQASGFVLVLGASGCGKSSLVRAGVMPRLDPSRLGKPATDRWVVPAPLTAGGGMEALVRGLDLAFEDAGKPQQVGAVRNRLPSVDAIENDPSTAAADLRTLASDLLIARGLAEGRVLLVLDQLEEVFGTPPGSEARALLRLLLAAGADGGSPVRVLATMRSDFLNAFQLFPGAAEQYTPIQLDPMPRSRFAELIEGPAARFGLDIDSEFTDRLVQDTAYDDALPLLAYTLQQLYKAGSSDGGLSLENYRVRFPPVLVSHDDGSSTEYGGVSVAIKHVADRILDEEGYAGLNEDDPRLRDLRRAFYSLAQLGEADQFPRRTALWSQMRDSCGALLNRFVQARLLVSSGTGDGQRSLTVAHEALFRVWDTLNAWLRKDRKALALRAQIEDAAAEWEAAKRDESRHWPAERVLDAVREIARSGVTLADVAQPDVVRAFLGPTDVEELERLPAHDDEADAAAGSGIYGDAWRLPLSHEARASVGVRLALLGDRRRGVGLRGDGLPDIDWCKVESGKVTIEIRANPDDPNSKVADTIRRSVEPFWIARYPVTVSQFQAFLADCYRNSRWQLPPGFPIELPADYPPPKHRARHGNHPADSVNWWDAMLFCHWLGARLYLDPGALRLPTEFEWQLAATAGDSKRVYPWGPDWEPHREPWRANTLESELNRSTAVGLYPMGASPTGALDMAGTVYEWCLNGFEDLDDTNLPGSQQDHRVLRGGSWYGSPDFARSALRSGLNPVYRTTTSAFGCCVRPPSSTSDH